MHDQADEAWHSSYQNTVGDVRGDRVILVRTVSPYLRLEIEVPGILGLPPVGRRRQARRAIRSALADLQDAAYVADRLASE